MIPIALLAAISLSISLAYIKDLVSDSPKIERDLRGLLPPSVPVLATIPRLTGQEERRIAIRFVAAALTVFLVGCALNVAIFLRYHPKV
jgi:hypothetical protein